MSKKSPGFWQDVIIDESSFAQLSARGCIWVWRKSKIFKGCLQPNVKLGWYPGMAKGAIWSAGKLGIDKVMLQKNLSVPHKGLVPMFF